MMICLFQSVKPTSKKVLFGIGRLFVWAIGIQILGEMGLVSESFKMILHSYIGWLFILRGKNTLNYSVKKMESGGI